MDISDIYYRIGLFLDYESVIKFRMVKSELYELLGSNLFWLDKCQKDFGVSIDRYNDIMIDSKRGGEIYIYLAALDNNPLPGTERYGDLYKLAKASIKNYNSNIKLIKFYCHLNPKDYRIFKICSQMNKLSFLQGVYPDEIYLDKKDEIDSLILEGACMGGYLSVMDSRFPTFRYNEFYTMRFFHKAVKYQNLPLIKYLGRYLSSKEELYIACKIGSEEIVEYLLERGASDFSSGLMGASLGNDDKLINKMIALGADPYLNLKAIGICGRLHLINLASLDPQQLNDLLMGSIIGGHLSNIASLINLGADNLELALNSAIIEKQYSIVNYLLNRKIAINENMVAAAILEGNLPIFHLLMTKVIPPIKIISEYCESIARCPNIIIFQEIMTLTPESMYPQILIEIAKWGKLDNMRQLLRMTSDKYTYLYPKLFEIASKGDNINFNIIFELARRGGKWKKIKYSLPDQAIKYLKTMQF